jgi:hypothetical protein
MLHRIFSHRFTAVFVILAVAILSASQARAQVAGATLSGTVTDPSGAAIADAKVTILNKATGQMRDATAGAGGFYSVPNLFRVTMTSRYRPPGFQPASSPTSRSPSGPSRS